ncbi:type II toxin-antitoxin system HicB family antitoxin [Bartonella bovis]|uniref:HicB family protein n=1 Tax=Bartonella bovis 91-4 TaxID=1094491 RepID=N6VG04_9HYPH|nr:type II toxin-antitoxin system HicB family antitoxin [Bartonella bovis]ENN91141.1 HicB family protein [Bartonella bovis 91-4]ENN92700.1 HicB family protein [Bartonella bovis 91-4]
MNNNHYTYRVLWSQEDEEYVGLCAEFPSLSWLDVKAENALKGIMNLVTEVVEDMQRNGEDVPIPLSHVKYSGKFQLRIPPELHRQLAIQAAENGVSLNRYISSKL